MKSFCFGCSVLSMNCVNLEFLCVFVMSEVGMFNFKSFCVVLLLSVYYGRWFYRGLFFR